MSLAFYVGATEDLYVSVAGFTVAGQPADPTAYTASLALLRSGDDTADAEWLDAAWVDGANPPLACTVTPIPFAEADILWLYLRIANARESLIRQACRIRVKTGP